MRVHFESEESIELLKKKLVRRPRFNVRDVFRYLDYHNEDQITRNGLLMILEDNLYYPTNIELDMLYDRFDKNRNGKVTYNEFLDELMPKNCIK